MRMRRPAGRQEQESDGIPGGVAEEWNEQLRVSTGAAALLQRVVRWGLWSVVCAGPLLGAVALAQSPSESAVAAQRPAVESRASQAVDTAGPGGFAALAVEAYLTAAEGDEERLAPYFPEAALEGGVSLPGEAETDAVERVAPVRVAKAGSGTWSVTVSARLDGGVRYFQVPVAERRGQDGLVGMALPGEVAAPKQAELVELDYGRPAPPRDGDPAAATLQAFFDAYLTGGGQLERYLSPGTSLHAVSPAPYARAEVTQFALSGSDDADEGAEAEKPPADGQRQQLLVDVEAEAAKGVERPMTYALELAARDGRWEVAGLQPAPRTSSQATAREGVQ